MTICIVIIGMGQGRMSQRPTSRVHLLNKLIGYYRPTRSDGNLISWHNCVRDGYRRPTSAPKVTGRR